MNHRAAGACAVAVILLWPAVAGAWAAGSPAQVVKGTYFGVTLSASTGSWPATVPFGTVGKTASGGSSGTYWSTLEPSNGTFAWTPLDDLVAAAKGAGVNEIMYTFFETPTWASSQPSQTCFATSNFGIYGCAAPPKNLGDWDRFVTALVSRYKGEIQFYELWNEPNVPSEFSGNISAMVSMGKDAYAIIHSVDPSARLLTPGVSLAGIEPYAPGCVISQCWLATYLMDGGAAYADGVAFHGKTCTADNQICVQEEISCPTTELPTCEDSGLTAQISDVKSIMTANGISGRLIINTEGGYSDEVGQRSLWGSEEHQIAFVTRFYIVQASENVSIAVWFSWLSNKQSGISGFGTSVYAAQNNQAYQTVRGWLLNSSFTGPCSQYDGLWTCGITASSGEQETIAWAENDSVGAVYSPGQPVQYQDVNGTAHEAPSGVNLNEDPILASPLVVTSSTSSTTSSSASTVSSISTSTAVTTFSSSSGGRTTQSTTVSSSTGSTYSSVPAAPSSSNYGGGIPEYPYQVAAVAVFVSTVLIGYAILHSRKQKQ